MTTLSCLAPAVVVVALASSVGLSAEMKQEMKFDRTNLRGLRSRFGTYGYQPSMSIVQEADGLRIWLPPDVSGVGQTGMYAYFALAGDCEVTLAYELLNLQPCSKGYGSGVGLALDAGDEVGRGTIQRVYKPGEGNGYVVQAALARAGKGVKEEYRFVPAVAERGRLGLRRVKNDLVFLAADAADAPLQEIVRFPFTDRTIRSVRLFADAGGSPTAVDVRVLEMTIRAEEIAGGTPRIQKGASGRWWLWLVVPAGCGVLLLGLRRVWRSIGGEKPKFGIHSR